MPGALCAPYLPTPAPAPILEVEGGTSAFPYHNRENVHDKTKIFHYTKNEENHKLNEKRQSISDHGYLEMGKAADLNGSEVSTLHSK